MKHHRRLIKVAAAALNQTPLAWEHNKANIIASIEAAREQGATVLCLPELCITGYGCEDMFHAPSVHAMAEQVLLELVPHTHDMVVSLGLPMKFSVVIIKPSLLNVIWIVVPNSHFG